MSSKGTLQNKKIFNSTIHIPIDPRYQTEQRAQLLIQSCLSNFKDRV